MAQRPQRQRATGGAVGIEIGDDQDAPAFAQGGVKNNSTAFPCRGASGGVSSRNSRCNSSAERTPDGVDALQQRTDR